MTNSDEKWFKISAYNSTPYWAYGSEDEAVRFCDNLNKARDVNLFTFDELDDYVDGGEGFSLAIALADAAENDE